LKENKNTELMVTLCVRSTFDLALQAYDFPPGTEILVTPLNIPHMI